MWHIEIDDQHYMETTSEEEARMAYNELFNSTDDSVSIRLMHNSTIITEIIGKPTQENED